MNSNNDQGLNHLSATLAWVGTVVPLAWIIVTCIKVFGAD